MEGFNNVQGKPVLLAIVKAVQDNKAYLGEIDGLIGDGDHGMNMNKGFTLFADRYGSGDISFTDGLEQLGMVLLGEIGGSMGPIYGTVFTEMARAGASFDVVGLDELSLMLEAGLTGLQDIIEAKVGDKTLIDTLSPAVYTLKAEAGTEGCFAQALDRMKAAAKAGRDSTKDMAAKYGRSSRLGERSRGVPDAGAVSCCIILCAMADGIKEIL
ncbi:dihydroxyacetone kinase subunit L [Lachnospiraceae bacterium]|uniref:dihydroxyacetone kinase subunit DhaL n=1 Tax=Extibacter sp. GGCC_0201 TaxID=2731209 RepID=UPI001AA0DDD8|nr:dihydroxyacetone kinase subunit DhaL [Extibacter sp. GGCC_0201]MBO1721144.1 dihydroxyacetone kinase subunit L [Extibacter sp. GGCC_0201]BDF35416.1 dihydroxyacetone kinase subunit L [Lachnospiraceae bacterium]BDF39418.1 dihydroxyacetone kinase subunit L [Lachnospiraceae bacterium]